MNRMKWQVVLGSILLALSSACYFLHYVIFRDPHHIFIYLVGDIAFVFVEVLLVTLIIHGLLEGREKRSRLSKLNMVIGVFFSEVGTKLLNDLARWDPDAEELKARMRTTSPAPGNALGKIRESLDGHAYAVDAATIDWQDLRDHLVEKRNFLVRLLENPNLLEHESFTDLLWAIFHLTEELDARPGFEDMPDTDRRHLTGDAKRVYGKLALQWLDYMEHLRTGYPYLFSLALRMNPFDPSASPVVSEA